MILVFGKTGQVGTELKKFDGLLCLGRDEANLECPLYCFSIITKLKPKAVINAAAYTDVNEAENNEELATLINAHSPAAMASACNTLGIPFIQLSTDYVFNGSGSSARTSDDSTNPINAYGRSKLLGEILISKKTDYFVILRTSWVFSDIGDNFVNKIIRLSASRKEINVVDNQIGGPTSAKSIAAACLDIIPQLIDNSKKSGIYHYVGTPNVSRFQFAEKIVSIAKAQVRLIPFSNTSFVNEAQRPTNSRLCCRSLKTKLGIDQPEWEKDLAELFRGREAGEK